MKQNIPLASGNFIGFPVVVASAIGLNESIFLNQLHYWLQRSNNERDGFIWVYKTIEEWKEEFPFWSDSTIKRLKKDLEKRHFLIVANYNKMKMDRTLWYRIDYERLYDALGQNEPMEKVKMTQCTVQNEPMEQVKMTQPITIDYTETTTENNNMSGKPNCSYPFDEIVSYLNSKCGKSFRASTKATQSLIKARLNEGFTVDDFKQVIDTMAAEWTGKTFSNGTLGDNYLQPSTLFGTKFESYLNQKPVKSVPVNGPVRFTEVNMED